MIIYAVITTARQVDGGEMIFIKTEKAFKQAGKADVLVKQLNQSFRTPDNKYKPMKFSTEHGDVECFCVSGGFELDVEE
jgi:hypothetical protein